MNLRALITAGPTYEAIDPVRFIGNRSSGRMGAALAEAALAAGHEVTLILGPISAPLPSILAKARRIDVVSARDMLDAVIREFPAHDLLIMVAAVSDFRPKKFQSNKTERGGQLTIELEPTEDILAATSQIKRPDQRTVGFSLVARNDLARSKEKLNRKRLDLIVHNPLETMNSANVEATLIYPDGLIEELASMTKENFARMLIERAAALFSS